MGHGTPDYWGGAPKATTYGLQDMGELAARLGSPINFDRRGDVMDFTTFANGWGRYAKAGVGGSPAFYISGYYPEYGSLCAVLKTGAVAGNYAYLNNNLFYPSLGGLGIEVGFSAADNLREVEIDAELYNGTTLQRFNTKYVHTSGKIQVQHSDNLWYDLATPGIVDTTFNAYTILKTVFNSLTAKYMRVLFNGASYIASAYTGPSQAFVNPKTMVIYVFVTTNINAATEVRIGHVVITQNEPS